MENPKLVSLTVNGQERTYIESCPNCGNKITISPLHRWDNNGVIECAAVDPKCSGCDMQLRVIVPIFRRTESGYCLVIAGNRDLLHLLED